MLIICMFIGKKKIQKKKNKVSVNYPWTIFYYISQNYGHLMVIAYGLLFEISF